MGWSGFDSTKPTDTRRWDGADNDIRTNFAAIGSVFKDVDQYASLAAAIASIGSEVTTLSVSSSQTITANVTFPSTMTLLFHPGGVFVQDDEYTVTINGPLVAGPTQIFSGFAAGNITLGAFAKTKIYPEWWGIDGTADDVQINLAIQAAMDFGQVYLTQETYACSSTIVFAKLTQLSGSGGGNAMQNVGLIGHGTKVVSTAADTIIEVGQASPLTGAYYCNISGIEFDSDTATIGMYHRGQSNGNNKFTDLVFVGNQNSLTNSMGLLLFPDSSGNHDNLWLSCTFSRWEICVSAGYNFLTSTGVSSAFAPNANRWVNCIVNNHEQYGLYLYKTVGSYFMGDFEAGSHPATADVSLAGGTRHSTLLVRCESGATAGILIASDCNLNLIMAHVLSGYTNPYVDSTVDKNNIFQGTYNGQLITAGQQAEFLRIRRPVNTGGAAPLTIETSDDKYLMTQTIGKWIDVDNSIADFELDLTQANTTEQIVNVGAIVQAYGQILSVQLRCFETVAGSGSAVMSIDVGTSSGGNQLLAAANVDSANDFSSTANASAPLIAAITTNTSVYVNFTPTANWNTLTAGQWMIAVTYIDYNRIKALKVG